jgi:peptidoglycan/LPS O-acetylase OafA/YrhL
MRALAVAAVVAYHFGGGDTSWLPGGFLGVDVFFVLSGYLITSLLLAEYNRRGRIDLPGFWARRVRRLVPALVAMLLAVCAWIWWATPLESYPARRSDLMWTVGYLANWHYIEKADDYFAAYTVASPLRHTWSLAVEEQFYLVWPLLLALVLWAGHRLSRRFGRSTWSGSSRLGLVGLVAGLGVGLSAWAMAADYDPVSPSTAYYSTQGRVQELFVGVLLAALITWWRSAAESDSQFAAALRLLIRRRGPVLSRYSGWLAALGVAGLVMAFLWMSDVTAFYYQGGALAVSLAVAAVIGVLDLRPQGAPARAFSWAPAVALGRISYGVYLWHWPIVLMIPVLATQPTDTQIRHQVERIALTLLLSILSYRFLEQPIQRDRRWLTSKRRVFVAVLASSALVVGVAFPATALPGTLAKQLSITSDRSCLGERVDLLISCTAPEKADADRNPPDLALLGDSTARALGPGLDDWARSNGKTWVEAAWKRCTATGLMVVPSNLTEPDLPATTCSDQAPGLIKTMLSTYRPKTVLVAEFWSSGQPLLVNGVRIEPGTAAHDQALRTAYQALVDEIAQYGGRTVFVELPPPGASIGHQYAAWRPAAGARPAVSGGGHYVDGYNKVLEEVAASRPGQAGTVSITDLLCAGGKCPAVKDGTLLRTDGLHYSMQFSHQLVPILLQRAGVSG